MSNVAITPKTNEIHKIKLKGSDTQHNFIDEAARESLSNVQISLDNNYQSTDKVLGLTSPVTNDTFQAAIQKLHAGLYTDELVIQNGLNNLDERVTAITPIDYYKQYLTFEALQDGTFQFSNAINYSIDNGTTWVVLAANTATPTINAGNKIMWKGELTPNSGIGTFSSTANFNIEGNVMSLLYGDNFIRQTDLTGKYRTFYSLFSGCSKLINAKNLSLPAITLGNSCYQRMFSGCTSLTTVPELPATTLADSCYKMMFSGCTSLTTAPELPATTLASGCYSNMFSGCTSLTTAPELPATKLAQSCYKEMFQGCTSLTTVPELPATTLAQSCYKEMFQSCTSLTTAPELPTTTLATQCYNGMFQGCTSLTTAPELPATTLADSCYKEMFQGCTSLTTAPELPATTLASNCYQEMFYGCTSLNYIKAMFTTEQTTSYTTNNWVAGVAGTGTFVKNSAATWTTTGTSGVPSGWTVYTDTEYEVARRYEINDLDTRLSDLTTSIETILQTI